MSRFRRFLQIEPREPGPRSRPAPDATPDPPAPELPAPEPARPPRGERLTPAQQAWVSDQLRKDWEGDLLGRVDGQIEALRRRVLARVPEHVRSPVRYGAMAFAGVLVLIGLFGGGGFRLRVALLAVAIAIGYLFAPER